MSHYERYNMIHQLEFEFMKNTLECGCSGAGGCQCSIPTQTLVAHNKTIEVQERYEDYIRRKVAELDKQQLI